MMGGVSSVPAPIDNSLFPWVIPVNPYLPSTGHTQWNTITAVAQAIGDGWLISAGTINNLVYWELVLAKGTWQLEWIYTKLTNGGIYTPSIGPAGGAAQVDKTTVDCYAAAPVYNQLASVNLGAVDATAKYRVQLKMTGKNASSTNYYGTINAGLQLRRTA